MNWELKSNAKIPQIKLKIVVKTYGESAVKVIIWKGEKIEKCRKIKVLLIKICHLKYRAHDKNHNFVTGCIDLC